MAVQPAKEPTDDSANREPFAIKRRFREGWLEFQNDEGNNECANS
jgi:hypothetical protein